MFFLIDIVSINGEVSLAADSQQISDRVKQGYMVVSNKRLVLVIPIDGAVL